MTRALRVVSRTVGELLVTGGGLLLLFVVWQLVWTDVVANAQAARTLEDLRATFVSEAVEPGTPAAPAPGTPDTPDTGGDGTPAALRPGDGVAILHVPSVGLERPVLEGTELEVLDQGVLGRYSHSAMPGEIGNFAVAGHRNTFGRPLTALGEMSPGDAVVVEVAEGWHVYVFDRHRVVLPHQTEVVAPVPDQPGVEPTEAWMVMTACHPRFSAAQRLIGYALHDRFVERADGPPAEFGGTG